MTLLEAIIGTKFVAEGYVFSTISSIEMYPNAWDITRTVFEVLGNNQAYRIIG